MQICKDLFVTICLMTRLRYLNKVFSVAPLILLCCSAYHIASLLMYDHCASTLPCSSLLSLTMILTNNLGSHQISVLVVLTCIFVITKSWFSGCSDDTVCAVFHLDDGMIAAVFVSSATHFLCWCAFFTAFLIHLVAVVWCVTCS